MMVPTKIYGIRLIGETEMRYIGRTQKALWQRLYGHRYECRRMPRPTDYAAWINANTDNIEIVQLSVVGDWSAAKLAERDTILLCLAMGHRLFNRWLVPAAIRPPSRSVAALESLAA